jgi:hypothetical protein
MNDSHFHVMWVLAIEVHITISMSWLPVHFCGQIWTPLLNQDVQERKVIISLNIRSEFDGSPNAVKMVKKLNNPC